HATTNPPARLTAPTPYANSTIALLQSPDPLLLRQALNGDLDLDGAVTISDFLDLASNFNSSGPNITWQQGDLNYDGAVTISDFIDLAANFGSSYAAAASSPSPVPEPTSLLLLFFLPLLRRRQFRAQTV